MTNFFAKAYLKYNLGDDIFIDTISKRYPNCMFEIFSSERYNFVFEKNVKVYGNLKNKITNKMIKLLSNGKSSLQITKIKKTECAILIGGSMFIENKSHIPSDLLMSKKYFILGSNFGPYHSEEYYKTMHNIFSKAEDVCFRDEYSYNLFKDLPNVRVAPDIVFSLNTDNLNLKEDNRVIISVIDCNNRKIENYKEQYESKIIEMIKMFQAKNYKITLMSFCKFEGDENAIERILTKVENVDKYYYNGNIEEALNIIAESKIIVGTRFHANILGLVMNKTVIPIAYSDKTLNVLKDINFKGKVFDIRNMDDFDINSISDKDLNYKCNVDKQKKEAKKHFEKLDLFLKENNNE